MSLINVKLLQVEELEDRELKAIKRKRKVNEYCWTLKSVLIEYLLVNYDLPSILYCDGDLCFSLTLILFLRNGVTILSS